VPPSQSRFPSDKLNGTEGVQRRAHAQTLLVPVAVTCCASHGWAGISGRGACVLLGRRRRSVSVALRRLHVAIMSLSRVHDRLAHQLVRSRSCGRTGTPARLRACIMLADRAADRPESYRAWCVDPTTTVRDEMTKAAGAGCVVSGVAVWDDDNDEQVPSTDDMSTCMNGSTHTQLPL